MATLEDKKELEAIRNYAKIDHTYDDDLLVELKHAAELLICDAISSECKPEDFEDDPRFSIAVKKQVKEDYELRGQTADTVRHTIANGIVPIIHQLRAKCIE